MSNLTLGYSPCPNDTFIFYALVHGKIDTGGLGFKETLLDIETLNRMALQTKLDVTKVSSHAFGHLRDRYRLLRAGGAMGRRCGPLVVTKSPCEAATLRGKRVAIPGRLTTAFLLLGLFDPALWENAVEMRFDLIPEAVRDGTVDAGLIIHESRFTYQALGLSSILDLGEWWEKETGLPIPLGFIIAKKSLGEGVIGAVDNLIRQSVLYAMSRRDEPLSYIKGHSQEPEDSVIDQHIGLYVNDYSVDIGDEGLKAVHELYRRAEEGGILKKSPNPAF